MFDKDRFIQQCRGAVADGPSAIREIVAGRPQEQNR
jgi:hypothetical protein